MGRVGFHASHELYPPSELLRQVRKAEEAGFLAATCSDHFHPWTPSQGQSGFAWSWLGAAMGATRLDFGVVNAPGRRYHPAIIAQAAATLAEMFPGRFWVALGSGQFLNEHVDGDPWPPKPERNARLREAVDVIRALWAGETVDHRGHFRVKNARLYTRPAEPPLIFGAALTDETAEWVGSWADGLLTVPGDPEGMRRRVEAFRRGGGEGKPMALQAAVAYDPDEGLARRAARERWPIAALELGQLAGLETPADFEAATAEATVDEVVANLRVSSDLGRHAAWIEADFALGFDAVYLHNVGPNPDRFLEAFAARVLPSAPEY